MRSTPAVQCSTTCIGVAGIRPCSLTVDWTLKICRPSTIAARALDWFLTSSIYGCGRAIYWDRVCEQLAASLAGIDSDRPLFLPYLYGERAPLWDPDLSAQWIGLRSSHGPSDLLLSVVEGICFS